MSTEVIKPYAGGEPGSRADAPAVIPYEGGAVIQTPQSQAAAAAATEFNAAMPHIDFSQPKRGINNLDPVSQARLNELRQRMRSNPSPPATVINLHPWPLQLGNTNIFLRGIKIPECNPGQHYAHGYIRSYRPDKEYKEDGTFKYSPITAIQMAGQFLRDFANADVYGGGIIIYEREIHPDKAEEVETYDQTGRLITIQEMGTEYDEENRAVRVPVDRPVKRKFSELLANEIKKRNAFYLARVKKADQDYNRPDGKGKMMVTEMHALMADVLVAEGILGAAPSWNLKGAVEMGLKDDPCPACGGLPKADSFKCVNCGHVLMPYEAYMAAAIEYGHASMDLMTGDEWEMVEKEKERRAANKASGKKQHAEAKKAVEKPA